MGEKKKKQSKPWFTKASEIYGGLGEGCVSSQIESQDGALLLLTAQGDRDQEPEGKHNHSAPPLPPP